MSHTNECALGHEARESREGGVCFSLLACTAGLCTWVSRKPLGAQEAAHSAFYQGPDAICAEDVQDEVHILADQEVELEQEVGQSCRSVPVTQ